MATNISKVYLLTVPLEDDMKNTLYFASATAQHNYFAGVVGKTYTNVSYQSESRTFRCKDEIDSIRQYNYIMWQNTAYSNKWFYAFIKKMTWVSGGYTDVEFEVDPLQTYMFDITIKPSFIEREHTNNDTVGNNTYPEDLELGEMICNGPVTNFGGPSASQWRTDYYIVIEVSQVENKGQDGTMSKHWVSGNHDLTPYMNGIERGTIPLIIGGGFVGHSSGVERTIDQITYLYESAGLIDSIINIYMLPKDLVGGFNELEIQVTPKVGSVIKYDGIGVPVSSLGTTNMGTTTFTRPSSINGYTPRNKKLLTYPYQYFNISNNAGTCQPFRYEDFSSSISFKTEGTFGVSGSTKTIPQNYLNVSSSENALDYSITGPKYPVCSWKSDSYTNWLTQNAINMDREQKEAVIKGAVQGVGAAAGLIGAAAMTGSLVSIPALAALTAGATAAPFIGTVKDQIKAKTQANLVADQVKGNLNAGDFLWAKYRSPFTFIPMSIKAQYARICDDFFDAFGYQVNRIKTPNTNHRQNWWYTKTMNANIIGNVPNDEMNKIKSAYNNGLTFWKNPSNFLNYGVSNGIV